MKIYLNHSTNFDFKKNLYNPIKKSKLSKNFIFPHQNSLKPYSTKKFFALKKCDLIIAEVSFPSTGQGIELGWANDYEIPIICFYKKGTKYSKALNSITKKIIKYNDEQDLIEKIKNLL